MKQKLATLVAGGLMTAGCSGETSHYSPDPIQPERVGYTSAEGEQIVRDYFDLAKAALISMELEGGETLEDVELVYVPNGHSMVCENDTIPVEGPDAYYIRDCNAVFVTQAIIDNIDEVIETPRRNKITRKIYPLLLKVIVGHELGHAVEHASDPKDGDFTLEAELRADCIGGELLHILEPDEADVLLKLPTAPYISTGDSLHGEPWQRSMAMEGGLVGLNSCIVSD